MKLSDFCKGIEVLLPYYNKDSYCLGAEHDQIYLYATHRPLTPEDVARMRELGWFQEGRGDAYDPGESWSAFT